MADDSPELIAAEDLDRELRPGGESRSWLSAKANHLKITNAFLKQDKIAANVWEQVDISTLAEHAFWQKFAYFLSYTYTIEKAGKDKGKPLDEATAIPIFSSMLNEAKKRASGAQGSDEQKVCCVRTRAPACLPACILLALPAALPPPCRHLLTGLAPRIVCLLCLLQRSASLSRCLLGTAQSTRSG